MRDVFIIGFISAERHKGMYKDAVFERRKNTYVTPIDKPALMRKIKGLPDLGKETATPEHVIRERAEMLMAIDEGLGKILHELEARDELDRTAILLLGDHGYWYGEHGLNKERRLAYEEALRVPMLMRYPKLISNGTASEKLVLNIDIAPTLIEIGGGKPGSHIEGRSLVSLMEGNVPEAWRNSFLVEYYTDTVWPRMVNLGYKGIRTERYKYIQYTDLEGMDEFYDLKEDPYELNNSIDDEEYLVEIRTIKSILNKYLKN